MPPAFGQGNRVIGAGKAVTIFLVGGDIKQHRGIGPERVFEHVDGGNVRRLSDVLRICFAEIRGELEHAGPILDLILDPVL